MLRKGIKRDLLLLLGLVVDELDYMSFERSYRRAFFGDYKKSSVYTSIYKLLAIGDIEKVQKRGEPYLRLTSKGSRRIVDDIPVAQLAKRPWDGRWRMVIFDIEEREKRLRDSFRRKLVSLGFGQWQKSVYITPHDVADEVRRYLESNKLTPYCAVLIASRADLGDDKALARRVWQLDDLGERYVDLVDHCESVEDELKKGQVDEKEITTLWDEYKELLFDDPSLPIELLPDGWPAGEAHNSFSQLWSKIKRSRGLRIDGGFGKGVSFISNKVYKPR